MKKFLCFMLALVCILPTTLLVACDDKKEDASRVVNRIYQVQSCKEDNTDTTSEYADGKVQLYFRENLFKLEYTNNENPELNGFYGGTFETDDDKVILTTTQYGGYFKEVPGSDLLNKLYFTQLKYYDKTLKVESFIGGKIIQFVFVEAK